MRKKYDCALTVDASVTEHICRMVEREHAGARPVRRAIRDEIENDQKKKIEEDRKNETGRKIFRFL